ncbi:hypothetical protein T492DRAFT_54693 [Pavlovales sp. CCMP2436]|nr:hypothetical protein T492DRAFT_54693 [Pavlovales sp. CCMP2436]
MGRVLPLLVEVVHRRESSMQGRRHRLGSSSSGGDGASNRVFGRAGRASHRLLLPPWRGRRRRRVSVARTVQQRCRGGSMRGRRHLRSDGARSRILGRMGRAPPLLVEVVRRPRGQRAGPYPRRRTRYLPNGARSAPGAARTQSRLPRLPLRRAEVPRRQRARPQAPLKRRRSLPGHWPDGARPAPARGRAQARGQRARPPAAASARRGRGRRPPRWSLARSRERIERPAWPRRARGGRVRLHAAAPAAG